MILSPNQKQRDSSQSQEDRDTPGDREKCGGMSLTMDILIDTVFGWAAVIFSCSIV